MINAALSALGYIQDNMDFICDNPLQCLTIAFLSAGITSAIFLLWDKYKKRKYNEILDKSIELQKQLNSVTERYKVLEDKLSCAEIEKLAMGTGEHSATTAHQLVKGIREKYK